MTQYPQEFSVPYNNKMVVIHSIEALVARYAGYAARIDHAGEIEILVDGDEGLLEWVYVTELAPLEAATKN